MSIYNQWNYRAHLHEVSRGLKAQRPGFTLQKLAAKTGLQAPYLTNVFKERAHLNLDQAHAVGSELGLSEEEIEHLLLLVDFERSSLSSRRQKLKERIDKIRREKLKSKAHLQKEILETGTENETKFFLNPYYKIINAFLGIERYRENPAAIAQALHLDPRQVEAWIKDLIDMGFAQKTKEGLEKLKRNFHLSKDSPLCSPHQQLLSQVAARQVQSLPDAEKFNFAVTFSADAETRDQVQREFLKFLKSIESLVKDAPAHDVFGLSFDLFRWSQRD